MNSAVTGAIPAFTLATKEVTQNTAQGTMAQGGFVLR